jgi:alkylhydroperoxidase/carboxymuconolactone decarboxylase family protein YurZ
LASEHTSPSGASPTFKQRDDQFWESALLWKYSPKGMNPELGSYVHQYQGQTGSGQMLSPQMRELIASVMLIWRGFDRFAANHIRRLYRLGVTNEIVVEALWFAAPFLGRANALQGIRAMQQAADPGNLEGQMPADGVPTELVDFPELHLGEGVVVDDDTPLSATPEWQFIAQMDPRLAEIATRHYDHIFGAPTAGGLDWKLPIAARELIAVVALCGKGHVDMAADHMRRCIRYGATPRHLLDAISAGTMAGLITYQFGAQAMMKAGIQPTPPQASSNR